MFWRKKELTYDEELAVTVSHLQHWIEFIETEIAGEADNVEIADLGDMKVAQAKRVLLSLRSSLAFLEPMK